MNFTKRTNLQKSHLPVTGLCPVNSGKWGANCWYRFFSLLPSHCVTGLADLRTGSSGTCAPQFCYFTLEKLGLGELEVLQKNLMLGESLKPESAKKEAFLIERDFQFDRPPC